MGTDDAQVAWLRIGVTERHVLFDRQLENIFLSSCRRGGILSDVLRINRVFNYLKGRGHDEGKLLTPSFIASIRGGVCTRSTDLGYTEMADSEMRIIDAVISVI
jgi:hypothetical protein